jgi:hypothetical protein
MFNHQFYLYLEFVKNTALSLLAFVMHETLTEVEGSVHLTSSLR